MESEKLITLVLGVAVAIVFLLLVISITVSITGRATSEAGQGFFSSSPFVSAGSLWLLFVALVLLATLLAIRMDPLHRKKTNLALFQDSLFQKIHDITFFARTYLPDHFNEEQAYHALLEKGYETEHIALFLQIMKKEKQLLSLLTYMNSHVSRRHSAHEVILWLSAQGADVPTLAVVYALYETEYN